MKQKNKHNLKKYEIPKCLDCGKDILRRGDLICLKCEAKEYREYLRDIDSGMNDSSNYEE